MNFLLVVIGKIISIFLKIFKRGSATALPGLVALNLNPHFCVSFSAQFKKGVILISGTNGKTTTASLVARILQDQNNEVIHNVSGSNLLRGIASTFIKKSNLFGQIQADFGVFEIDEAALPNVIRELQPQIIILNNLFRDQLDRYGELDTLAQKWQAVLAKLSPKTNLILNADDPLVACLGKNLSLSKSYYGLRIKNLNKKLHHSADSVFCPTCFSTLTYLQHYYSHIGNWFCPKCHLQSPSLNLTAIQLKIQTSSQEITLSSSLSKKQEPIILQSKLLGLYNVYNLLAAYLTSETLNLDAEKTQQTIFNFEPAFGRQEKLKIDNKEIFILLSKNPTGFTQSLETISNFKPQNILLALNDRIADGEDVSWIADVDFSSLNITSINNLTVSGIRAYDLALRLKYELSQGQSYLQKWRIEPQLEIAIQKALEKTSENEILYILPTYTAMLEIRKILTGKDLNS